MSVNVQTKNGLKQIADKTTKNKILNVLGYTPASQEDLINHRGDVDIHISSLEKDKWDNKPETYEELKEKPSISEDETDILYVVDENNNIIAYVDNRGIHTIALEVITQDGKKDIVEFIKESILKLRNDIQESISLDYNDLDNKPIENEENNNALYVTDDSGNIIARFDSNGLNVTNVVINGKKAATLDDILNSGGGSGGGEYPSNPIFESVDVTSSLSAENISTNEIDVNGVTFIDSSGISTNNITTSEGVTTSLVNATVGVDVGNYTSIDGEHVSTKRVYADKILVGEDKFTVELDNNGVPMLTLENSNGDYIKLDPYFMSANGKKVFEFDSEITTEYNGLNIFGNSETAFLIQSKGRPYWSNENYEWKEIALKEDVSYYRPLCGRDSTVIESNKDINAVTYLYVGSYVCGTDANADSLVNCPTDKAFIMEVSSQSAINVDPSTSSWVYRVRRIYTRIGEEYVQEVHKTPTSNGVVYSDWKKIITSAKLTETLKEYVKSSDIPEIPEIPTKTSQLENDMKYVNIDKLYTRRKFIQIEDGSDINNTTYLIPGIYSGLGNELVNSPTDKAFIMEVFGYGVGSIIDDVDKAMYVYRFRKITDLYGNIYTQKCNSESTPGQFIYNDWIKVATKNDIPTKTSQLENDSSYLTEIPDSLTIHDLTLYHSTDSQNIWYDNKEGAIKTSNLYLTGNLSVVGTAYLPKLNTSTITSYSQPKWSDGTTTKTLATLDDLASVSSLDIQVVTELPTENISSTTIYLKPVGGDEQNIYEEYIYVKRDAWHVSDWELIGTTKVDLSNYATKDELPTKVSQLENDSGYLTKVPSDATFTTIKLKGNTGGNSGQISYHGATAYGSTSYISIDDNVDISGDLSASSVNTSTIKSSSQPRWNNGTTTKTLATLDDISGGGGSAELPKEPEFKSVTVTDTGEPFVKVVSKDDDTTYTRVSPNYIDSYCGSSNAYLSAEEGGVYTTNNDGTSLWSSHYTNQGMHTSQDDDSMFASLTPGSLSLSCGYSNSYIDLYTEDGYSQFKYQDTYINIDSEGISTGFSDEEGITAKYGVEGTQLTRDSRHIYLSPEVSGMEVKNDEKNTQTTYTDDHILFEKNKVSYTLSFPEKSGTLATTDDIQNSGFISSNQTTQPTWNGKELLTMDDLYRRQELVYVTDDSDLNSPQWTNPGRYVGNSGQVSNRPSDAEGFFILEVYSYSVPPNDSQTSTWSYRVRKYMDYLGNSYIQRAYTGGTSDWIFTAWEKELTSANISSLFDNGNTGAY